jgi:hypothetical protein
MNTFQIIISKVLKLENNLFSYNYKKDNIEEIYKIMFYGFFKNISNIVYFNEIINNFYFINKQIQREKFIMYFSYIKKIYNSLNRFCFLYKYKKSKIMVNKDLQLNNININDKNVICIYHVKSKYLFKLDELLKIIFNSLTNSHLFISSPIPVKNPYNNLPFSKSILYNIYIYFIHNFNIINYIKYDYIDLFIKFKNCDFNMTKFINKYEHILRDYSINNYIKSSTKLNIISKINEMIKEFNKNLKWNYHINIDKDFPNDILIKVMTPYLILYLNCLNSLIPVIKEQSKKDLYKKLHKFREYNPSFGRKIIISKFYFKKNFKIKLGKQNIVFDDKHIKFNEDNNFMKNHLSYQYETNNLHLYSDIFEETEDQESEDSDMFEETEDGETN